MYQPPGGGYPPGAPPPGSQPPAQPGWPAPQQGPYGAVPPGGYGQQYPQQAPYGYPPQGYPQGAPPMNPPAYIVTNAPIQYASQYGNQYGGGAVAHPRSTVALILGILSLLGFGMLTGLPAWIIGAGALREMRESPGRYTGEGEARTGMVLGIISTILTALVILAVVFFMFLLVSHSPRY